MLTTRVIPCLLLRGRALVKTVRFKNPRYVGDPVNAVNIFNTKEVDELVLLDITATRERRKPPLGLLAEVASECFMPLTYGGGITELEDLAELFAVGIEKVAINSHVVEDSEFVRAAAARFGSQSIVVSIDVRKDRRGRYRVFTRGGEKDTGLDAVDHAMESVERGAGEIFLTSIDRDGTREGYDLDLTRRVADAVNVPVVACGGAGTVADFASAIQEGHASAVAAGSMVVYHGRNQAVLINFPSKQELEQVLSP